MMAKAHTVSACFSHHKMRCIFRIPDPNQEPKSIAPSRQQEVIQRFEIPVSLPWIDAPMG
jgi:hypothetical protein